MRRKIVPKLNPEVTPEKTPAPSKTKELDLTVLKSIANAVDKSVENTNRILDIEESLVDVLRIISAPKDKKSWSCSVGRGSDGNISNINIKEV